MTVEWLYVERNSRNKGIATKLMNKSIDVSKEMGYDQMFLIVSPRDDETCLGKLIIFYEKFGFKILPSSTDTEIKMGKIINN